MQAALLEIMDIDSTTYVIRLLKVFSFTRRLINFTSVYFQRAEIVLSCRFQIFLFRT